MCKGESLMEVGNKIYGQYLQILREELIPAMR